MSDSRATTGVSADITVSDTLSAQIVDGGACFVPGHIGCQVLHLCRFPDDHASLGRTTIGSVKLAFKSNCKCKQIKNKRPKIRFFVKLD